MASYSGGINEDVIKTALDDVFVPEYNADMHPEHASAESEAVFHQSTADSSAVIWEAFKGVGLWKTKAEEQDVPQLTPLIANQKTFTVSEFAGSVDIPRTFKRDAKHERMQRASKIGLNGGHPFWAIPSQAFA